MIKNIIDYIMSQNLILDYPLQNDFLAIKKRKNNYILFCSFYDLGWWGIYCINVFWNIYVVEASNVV